MINGNLSENFTEAQMISSINIEYREGFYEVLRLMTPISRHLSYDDAVRSKAREERALGKLLGLM